MLCLRGFELYSRWVPLTIKTQDNKSAMELIGCKNFPLGPFSLKLLQMSEDSLKIRLDISTVNLSQTSLKW